MGSNIDDWVRVVVVIWIVVNIGMFRVVTESENGDPTIGKIIESSGRVSVTSSNVPKYSGGTLDEIPSTLL